MNHHDELSALLSQHLCLDGNQKVEYDSSELKETKTEKTKFYSICTHYHHSAHVAQALSKKASESVKREVAANVDSMEEVLDPASHEESKMDSIINGSDKQEWQLFTEADQVSHYYQVNRLDQYLLTDKPLFFEDLQSRSYLEWQTNENVVPPTDEDHDMNGDIIMDPMPVNENDLWLEVPLSNLCSYNVTADSELERPAGSEYHVESYFAESQGYSYATDPVYNKAPIDFYH